MRFHWQSALIATLATLLCPSVGAAQSLATQAGMHARIQSIYNFSPSKVTDQVRTAKSAEMDSFWKEVNSHPAAELPLLRVELSAPDSPRFFYADGSELLLSLSQSPEDRKIAAQALGWVDLSDFESHQYLLEVHSLAVKGTDVTAAAFHMLDDPKFKVFLPEHVFWLDQSACLQVALLPLKTQVWLPATLARIKEEHDESALKSLLLLLYYAQTNDADRMIKAFAADSGSPSNSREFAQSILKHESEVGIGTQPSPELEAKYREERRLRMAGVSDEAMDDMNELTTKIARARTLSE